MDDSDRRRQARLRFLWPLWFGYSDDGEFVQGKAVDLSNQAVSFTVSSERRPDVGDHVLTRFSFPMTTMQEFGIDGYYGWSEVMRVEDQGDQRHRVALRLHEPIESELGQPEMAGAMV